MEFAVSRSSSLLVRANTQPAVVDVLGALHLAADFDRAEQLRIDLETAHLKVEALTRERTVAGSNPCVAAVRSTLPGPLSCSTRLRRSLG